MVVTLGFLANSSTCWPALLPWPACFTPGLGQLKAAPFPARCCQKGRPEELEGLHAEPPSSPRELLLLQAVNPWSSRHPSQAQAARGFSPGVVSGLRGQSCPCQEWHQVLLGTCSGGRRARTGPSHREILLQRGPPSNTWPGGPCSVPGRPWGCPALLGRGCSA